jgi:signal transduction histidine kinase
VAKRVLVVDNDRLCVEMLGDILSQEGYEVVKAFDGMEAMEILGRGDLPDVVFLDIVMPRIDGDRVFEYIRAKPQTSQIPVVILSGTLMEDQTRILAMGADAYVAKGPRDRLRRNVLETLRRLESGEPTGNAQILGLENLIPHEKVRELLAIRQRRKAILEAIGQGIVELDGRGWVIAVNRAGLEILQRPELDLIGTQVADILGVDYRQTMEGALTRFLGSRDKVSAEVTLRYGERVVEIRFAWNSPGDSAAGFFVLLQDVTDLVGKIEALTALNSKLKVMDRVRSEFLTMISHDLHTPLTAIKGSLDVLLHEGVGVELSRELLGIAQKNADRLFRLVSDILDLARIEEGRFSMQREPFDVVVALRGTIDRLMRLAQEKRIALTLQAPDGLSLVFADGIRMEQVFTNLLGNALKFTPSGGRIGVLVKELTTELLVEVRDSGVGIPAEHLDRVFDRFYRVPLPAGTEVEGTGLGLSICKAVVEEHGGRIWVESVIGRGTAFFLTIPKVPAAS